MTMHSMTGFGRGSASTEHGNATVEIACVNRKQAEVVILGARDLTELETPIRKIVLQAISRGRIQVTLQFEPARSSETHARVDFPKVDALVQAIEQIRQRSHQPLELTAADFLRVPGLIDLGDSRLNAEIAWSAIEPALHIALQQLLTMRAAEGIDLTADLSQRLDTLETLAAQIANAAPSRPERYRELLFKRLRDARLELDLSDDRILREIALFADRCDISEEITRLDSHFRKFREYMTAAEPAGRSLDFLCQEIHREFNTIGSKATDASIAQNVVAAKTELEKIREQVQNVE